MFMIVKVKRKDQMSALLGELPGYHIDIFQTTNILNILLTIADIKMMILSKLEWLKRKSLGFAALFLVVIFVLVSFYRGPLDNFDRMYTYRNDSCFTGCIGW